MILRRAVLALAALDAATPWQPRPGPPRRAKARRRPSPCASSAAAAEASEGTKPGDAAAAVVAAAAELLRDGNRGGDLVGASKRVLELVSPKNNAINLSPSAFAQSIETHKAHYGPLLTFGDLDVRSADVAKDGARCTVRTGLRSPGGALLGTAVWTCSLDGGRGWLIDAVLVQPEAEAPPAEVPAKREAPERAPEREPVARPNPLAAEGAASFGALTSPRWVAKTVLSALRAIDEPERNHGCGVALTFVSKDNPAHKLTPELFRTYIDDDDYPYGVLKRWLEMTPEDVIFDEEKRKASHDVTLIDVDGSERLVTIELSKVGDTSPWLIDRFWCEEAY
mmetsp:Transcript_19663/g.58490  ORF Transcript_19663/g.58490 Transcript_19663/m.58490 type:complete len:338 (-) Transcript_19663:365-1378(-)